jgi:hypothetical protein
LWAGSDEHEENLQAIANESEQSLQPDEVEVEAEVEVTPTYFTQGQWANAFGDDFANSACTATS